MSWLARLRNVFRADRVDRDIEREMTFHLSQRADDLTASGMDPGDARLEARRRFGNYARQHEDTRERNLFVWLETLVADLRYAARGLRAAPGFTTVALLSLALGIGANTAIFTLINVAVLKPLPVHRPDELVELTLTGGEPSKGGSRFSPALWEQIRDRQDVFSGVFAYGSTGSGDLSTGGEMRPIPVGLVTGEFFTTLGVQPAAGRLLTNADDAPGCAGTVVLTHAFWRSEYGGDRGVIGKFVPVNGQPFEIVGVAEAEFFGLGFGYYPPVWAPQCAGPIIRGPTYRGGGAVIARLKPDVGIDAARARLTALTPGVLEATLPASATADAAQRHRGIAIGVQPFTRGFTFVQQEYGAALWTLMAIVGVVLLIACVNTANLLLARATARQREMAVRQALGASRARVMRQLLTESLLLALMGTVAGALFAAWGSRALVTLLSRDGRPMLRELPVDWRVLAFAAGAAVLTAILFGLAPAWRSVRVDAQSAIRPGGRGIAQGHSRFNLSKALVAGQVALSLVMVAGAGLLVGSWQRLIAVDPGFRSDGVLLVSVNARAAQIPDSQRSGAYRRLIETLRGVPGALNASASNRTPIGNTGWHNEIVIRDADGSAMRDATVQLNEVSDGYFATIGTRFIAGRDFNGGDRPGHALVAIVNAELARRFFDGRALGRRFAMSWGRDGTLTYEVVGVVADTKDANLREASQPIAYFALSQNAVPGPYLELAVRGTGPAGGIAAAVNAAIVQTHPRLSLRTRTLRDQVAESIRVPRTLGLLSAAFGVLALVLASIGLYGVLAYGVARRRNEIGVRIALGAEQSRIVRMVLGDMGRMVAWGVILGSLLALAAGRLIARFLYGVTPHDPPIFMLSVLTLVAVAIAAAALPARRAARMDPVAALRED